MDVIYSPRNGTGAGKWQFDWRDVLQSQAEQIEKKTGMGWEEWLAAIRFTGNSKARKALLWHLLSLEHPSLRWEDIPDFRMGELEVVFGLDELRDLKEMITKAPGVTNEMRSQILHTLDEQISAEMDRAVPGTVAADDEDGPGKEGSQASAADTASPSPSGSEYVPGSSVEISPSVNSSPQ